MTLIRHLPLAACITLFSIPAAATQATPLRRAVTPDFFVTTGSTTLEVYPGQPPTRPSDCRAHIADIMCLVKKDAAESPDSSLCQPGGAAYVEPFQALYDHLPAVLQPMFCSLKIINVHEELGATAYADRIMTKDGSSAGAKMGIRKSLLDEHLDLATWASWKEQLSFGGASDAYTPASDLPAIETRTLSPVNDFLYFVVVHEFGHMLDFANHLNQFEACEHPENGCPAKPGSWSALSWATDKEPLPGERFPYRKALCFYSCDGEGMTAAAVPEEFAGLAGANFISNYAASNPYDDLADSLAYLMMDQELGTAYAINTRQGAVYDVMAKLRSPLFAAKRQYLQDFLARGDIIFP